MKKEFEKMHELLGSINSQLKVTNYIAITVSVVNVITLLVIWRMI
jgi:hypothetical protein